MNPGKLDRRIQIQERIDTPNAVGDIVRSYPTRFNTWAHVREQRGQEGQQQEQRAATKRILVLIRYINCINETWRIVYQGRNYDITNIREADELGRRMYQYLECQAVGEGETG